MKEFDAYFKVDALNDKLADLFTESKKGPLYTFGPITRGAWDVEIQDNKRKIDTRSDEEKKEDQYRSDHGLKRLDRSKKTIKVKDKDGNTIEKEVRKRDPEYLVRDITLTHRESKEPIVFRTTYFLRDKNRDKTIWNPGEREEWESLPKSERMEQVPTYSIISPNGKKNSSSSPEVARNLASRINIDKDVALQLIELGTEAEELLKGETSSNSVSSEKDINLKIDAVRDELEDPDFEAEDLPELEEIMGQVVEMINSMDNERVRNSYLEDIVDIQKLIAEKK